MKKLKIFVDRLKNGLSEDIAEDLPPDFMEIDEPEIAFKSPIRLLGQCYLAEPHLILKFKIQTDALLLCKVCSEMAPFSINIKNFYHSVPLEEIQGSIFEYGEEVRSAILLQIPQFFECHEGCCPNREGLNRYLKTKLASDEHASQEVHFPFAQLENRDKKG